MVERARSITGRDAVVERERERTEGTRDPSQAFRDEVLAALTGELRRTSDDQRELRRVTGDLAIATERLTEEVVSLNLTMRTLCELLANDTKPNLIDPFACDPGCCDADAPCSKYLRRRELALQGLHSPAPATAGQIESSPALPNSAGIGPKSPAQ